MVNPDLLKTFLQIGLFIAIASIIAFLLQQPNSAGYYVSLMSLCIGAVMVALVIWLARRE